MILGRLSSVAGQFPDNWLKVAPEGPIGDSRNIGDAHVDNRVEVETAGAPSNCTNLSEAKRHPAY